MSNRFMDLLQIKSSVTFNKLWPWSNLIREILGTEETCFVTRDQGTSGKNSNNIYGPVTAPLL